MGSDGGATGGRPCGIGAGAGVDATWIDCGVAGTTVICGAVGPGGRLSGGGLDSDGMAGGGG
jgi:hypothetical protein